MAFFALAKLSDLHDGYMKAFKINNLKVILIQENGQRYLLEDRCPHMDAPLNTGSVADGAISCRVHGIAFSLESGQAKGPLADTLDCLKTYPLSYHGIQVGMDV